MHPGQYTVLNSPNDEVVDRAILDLEYHTKVLDCLRTGSNHKIILHIGGGYNDKQQAMRRFIENYQRLSVGVKQRLVIENDDKLYNIEEVLAIGRKLSIPVVFDNLHHETLGSLTLKSEVEWIEECKTTWSLRDGLQKIHYSQQDMDKKPGAHSASIEPTAFMRFYKALGREDIDIMLEVKDKNLSAIKCIKCITNIYRN
jgi:UV DNA damage endonuclease